MLGVTSILTALVFYCKLGEVLSFIKVFGMFFMIGAGVFLSMDEKTEDDADETGLTEAEMKQYGILAVGISCLPPITWTVQAYYYKKLISTGRFDPFDLAWDGACASYFLGFILHIVYLSTHEVDYSNYIGGSCVGVFQLTGQFLMLLSY